MTQIGKKWFVYDLIEEKIVYIDNDEQKIKNKIGSRNKRPLIENKIYRKRFILKRNYDLKLKVDISLETKIDILLKELCLTKRDLKEVTLFELETLDKKLKSYKIDEHDWYEYINKNAKVKFYGRN